MTTINYHPFNISISFVFSFLIQILYPNLVFHSFSLSLSFERFGTDEMRLIKELARTTPEQRCQVSARYPQVHGKELKKVMKSECGNRDFGTALQFLAVPTGTSRLFF
mmetsp:Transcript_43920/g.106502  ORF Transcript_43920/g.106502 Transcript_43920/m.106502 type:complete len:108 (+) Transcript_43920:33-356(+)